MKPLQHSLTAVRPTSLALLAKSTDFLAAPFHRLVGKWRLYWNYCPECNSCAPKMQGCAVCNADTKSYFVWNKEVEQTWWRRYADKHNFAA